MTHQNRIYTKTRRAANEALTVRRITEAAVDLHGTVGPSKTSMSAVARRAGVRRSTLYRHFPDESALFQACTAHFMAAHPLPDVSRWSEILDPGERMRTALYQLYAYYRQTAQMLRNVIRDEESTPAVREHIAAYYGYISAVKAILVRDRAARGVRRRNIEAATGHALAFSTWQSLAIEQGLSDQFCAEILCDLVALMDRGDTRA